MSNIVTLRETLKNESIRILNVYSNWERFTKGILEKSKLKNQSGEKHQNEAT